MLQKNVGRCREGTAKNEKQLRVMLGEENQLIPSGSRI
jgi:hypothetical protein